MQLIVKVKKVYGDKEFCYPVCETSAKLVKLLKQKSFTQRDIDILLDIGFTFKKQEQNEKCTVEQTKGAT